MSPKVSKDHKERIRGKIVMAAAEEFVEKGFQNTTMDGIVARSHLSKGSIYNYFASKEDMIAAVIENNKENRKRFFQIRLNSANSAKEKLEKWIQVYFFAHSANEKFGSRFNLEMWATTVHSEKLLEKTQDSLRNDPFIQAIITEGIQAGEFKPETDTKTLTTLFQAINAGISVLLALDLKIDLPKIEELIRSVIFREILVK